MQEVDEFESEWKEFIENEMNMGVFYKQRTQKSNKKRDGSLVCWNKEKFEDVELDTTGSVEDFKATCMSLTVSFNTEMYR